MGGGVKATGRDREWTLRERDGSGIDHCGTGTGMGNDSSGNGTGSGTAYQSHANLYYRIGWIHFL